MAASRCPHNSAQISGVYLRDGHGAAPAEKAPRALGVAVAAPNRMSLLLK
jgi:hypothetical protein